MCVRACVRVLPVAVPSLHLFSICGDELRPQNEEAIARPGGSAAARRSILMSQFCSRNRRPVLVGLLQCTGALYRKRKRDRNYTVVEITFLDTLKILLIANC